MHFQNNEYYFNKLLFLVMVIVISTLTSCTKTSNSQDVKPTPNLVNVLANPQHYIDDYVSLSGFLSKYMKLYLSKELAMLSLGNDGIQVQDITQEGSLINSRCLNRYVQLSGILKKSNDASNVYYITNVSQVFLYDNKKFIPCYLDKKSKEKHMQLEKKYIKFNKK